MGDQANRGATALAETVRQNTSGLRIPHLLNREIAIANVALNELGARVNQKTMNVLSQAFEHPEGVLDLLTRVPAADRTALRRFLIDNKSWLPPSLTAAAAATPDRKRTNAMAVESQNVNRFTQ